MALYTGGAVYDILQESIDDNLKILLSFSIMLSLVKLVYLVRVFSAMNFLVIMLINVCKEVFSFMILFIIFVLTFAEMNHILEVDITLYGRIPPITAHFTNILRGAMGDFAIIDPFQGFDVIDNPEAEGDEKYRHSYLIICFTYVLWGFSVFFTSMIFMNFIIAVISDTYNTVIEFREAHDYKQRVMMIYEREAQFNDKDFENPIYFPSVLIVRKKKENKTQKNNMQNWTANIKSFVKSQTNVALDYINLKTKEQKQHFTNQVKGIENEF